MGGLFSSSSAQSSSRDVVPTRAPSSFDLHITMLNGDKQDYYTLFGLDVYEKPDPAILRRKFNFLACRYHPDKQQDEADKTKCHTIMTALIDARDTLSDDSLRERYNRELRRSRGELSIWERAKECGYKLFSGAMLVGGMVTTCYTVFTGCPTPWSVLSGSLLGGGICGWKAASEKPFALSTCLCDTARGMAVGAGVGLLAGECCKAVGLDVAGKSLGNKFLNALVDHDDEDSVKTLYHQTDEETALKILGSDQMLPGSKGLAGGGIYFAENPSDTNHKAQKRGVILEAQVNLGGMKKLSARGDPSLNGIDLLLQGCDSVCVDRPGGQEFVVYNSGRVSNIRRYKGFPWS